MKKEFRWYRIEDVNRPAEGLLSGGRTGIVEPDKMVGTRVYDADGAEVGRVSCTWEDNSHHLSFVGIKTAWYEMGGAHVVPSEFAKYDSESSTVRVPFDGGTIREAPAYDSTVDIDSRRRREVFDYYNSRGGRESRPGTEQPERVDLAVGESGGGKEGKE